MHIDGPSQQCLQISHRWECPCRQGSFCTSVHCAPWSASCFYFPRHWSLLEPLWGHAEPGRVGLRCRGLVPGGRIKEQKQEPGVPGLVWSGPPLRRRVMPLDQVKWRPLQDACMGGGVDLAAVAYLRPLPSLPGRLHRPSPWPPPFPTCPLPVLSPHRCPSNDNKRQMEFHLVFH